MSTPSDIRRDYNDDEGFWIGGDSVPAEFIDCKVVKMSKEDHARYAVSLNDPYPPVFESSEFFCTIAELADLARQGLLLLAALCAGLAVGSFIA